MAKKTTGIDESIYVQRLVDVGMSNEEATTMVSGFVSKINELAPEESTENKMNMINITVNEVIAERKADKYRVTVAAVSSQYDGNAGIAKNHLKQYNDDPDGAIQRGLVKIVNGEPVAIDNRRFLDKEGTKENKGFGKKYPKRMKRDIIGINDGEIVVVSGDIDVIPGNTYEIFGKVSGAANILYATNDPIPRLLTSNSSGEFFDALKTAANNSNIAMDVDGALSTEERGIVIVKGYVQSALLFQTI